MRVLGCAWPRLPCCPCGLADGSVGGGQPQDARLALTLTAGAWPGLCPYALRRILQCVVRVPEQRAACPACQTPARCLARPLSLRVSACGRARALGGAVIAVARWPHPERSAQSAHSCCSSLAMRGGPVIGARGQHHHQSGLSGGRRGQRVPELGGGSRAGPGPHGASRAGEGQPQPCCAGTGPARHVRAVPRGRID